MPLKREHTAFGMQHALHVQVYTIQVLPCGSIQAVMPAPMHSTSQCCLSPLGGFTVNFAAVSISATLMAVLVWSVSSPHDILDVPCANAMKIMSWSCILQAASTHERAPFYHTTPSCAHGSPAHAISCLEPACNTKILL